MSYKPHKALGKFFGGPIGEPRIFATARVLRLAETGRTAPASQSSRRRRLLPPLLRSGTSA
eukprot:3903947-Pyramimonas_sp.AAC.1